MKFLTCGCWFLVAFGAACGAPAAEEKPKPISLFDGKTFKGWEGDTKNTWRIEDGALTAGSHERAAPRNEFLTTTKQFENFDLRLKFRIEGEKNINAGVQFRTQRIPDHHEVIGYQADIGEGYWGCLYDESRRRRILAAPKPEVVEQALKAIGEDGWHRYRILAEGPRVQLWINGVQTVDYTERDDEIARRGVIAMQIHGGMQAIIRYKDIRIVELTASDRDAATEDEVNIGVGAKPIEGAEVLFDGSRKMLDEKWTYWQGPRFSSSLPIKWKMVDDPVDEGMVVMTDDPAAAGGKYGAADIVTKQKFRDFRLHVEFLIVSKGGNSGVYLQNRYEIQILDGDKTSHGMGAVINETPSPYEAYRGIGKWNAYDVNFRAARFRDAQRVEKAMVTMYFNGKKVHENQTINQVWGGENSGLDGGNDGGKGITDTPGGLKLQCEGHEVLYRNIWIKPLTIDRPDANFRN